jgi:hypothetical protein
MKVSKSKSKVKVSSAIIPISQEIKSIEENVNLLLIIMSSRRIQAASAARRKGETYSSGRRR